MITKDPRLAKPMVDDHPHVWAEVDYALHYEDSKTADDVLSRRIPLLLTDRKQGLGVLPQVIELMKSHHGWSAQECEIQSQRYHQSVADSRRFVS